jgi:hypothetical protein
MFAELQQYVKIDELDDIVFFFAKNRHRRIGEFLSDREARCYE